MAAPTTAYATEKLNKTQGVTTEQVQIAKRLAEYGTQTETREKFYLDKEINLLSPTSQPHFIGGAYVGGTNINFHNPSRIVDLNIQKDGQVLARFNDAGLNTYGDLSVDLFSVRIDTPNNSLICNDVTFKSSYYNDTTQVGATVREEFEINWRDGLENRLIPANQSLYFQEYTIDIDPTNVYQFEAPKNYNCYYVIVNEEGRRETAFINVTAEPYSKYFWYSPFSPSQARLAGTTELWLTKRLMSIGDDLEYNGAIIVDYPDGFYVDTVLNANERYPYYYLTDGVITSIGEYEPQYRDLIYRISILGAGVDDLLGALNQAELNNWLPIGSIDVYLKHNAEAQRYEIAEVQGNDDYYQFINTYYILDGSTSTSDYTYVKNDNNGFYESTNAPTEQLLIDYITQNGTQIQ